MANDLTLLLTYIMELFIKPATFNENNTGYKLVTLDVSAHQLPAKKINIGNSARQALDGPGNACVSYYMYVADVYAMCVIIHLCSIFTFNKLFLSPVYVPIHVRVCICRYQ